MSSENDQIHLEPIVPRLRISVKKETEHSSEMTSSPLETSGEQGDKDKAQLQGHLLEEKGLMV